MSDKPSRKRRAPAVKVLGPHHEPTGIARRPDTALDKNQEIPVVVPAINRILQDLRTVVGHKAQELRASGDIGDGNGQLVRNLTATVAQLIDTEKKYGEGDALENLTPAELAAALRRQADEIEGVRSYAEEDDE